MKRSIQKWISAICINVAVFLTTVSNGEIKAQLSGSYTIGGTGSPDYTTLTSAVTALSASGVSGPVVFNIADGTYTEQIVIPEITGASEINTITFQSASTDSMAVTIKYSATLNNYVVKLNGADYVRFAHLTLQAVGTLSSTYTRVLELANGATNNEFSNNRFIGTDASNNDANSNKVLVYSGTTIDNNNIFCKNYFYKGTYGLFLAGESSTNMEEGNAISGNVFDLQVKGAVYYRYQSNAWITGNLSVSGTNCNIYYAYYMVDISNISPVSKNKISVPSCNSSYGIFLNSAAGSAETGMIINNNFVQLQTLYNSSSNELYGIFIHGSNIKVYNNNINLTGNTNYSYGLFLSYSSTNASIINNNFINVAKGYCYYIRAPFANFTSDYNNFYNNGTYKYHMQQTSSYDWVDLAKWQTMSGMDAHSVCIDPEYLSQTDLHVLSNPLNNLGSYLTDVETDIDNETRHTTTPDIGADEYTPPVNDVAVDEFTSPNSYPYGIYTPKVLYVNHGTSNLQSFIAYLELDGLVVDTLSWSGDLAYGLKTGEISYTDQNLTHGLHTFRTWTELPNNQADEVTKNDTLLFQVYAFGPFNGNFTLGASGCDFTTFQDAIDSLAHNGINGPVTITVKEGTYNEEIVIPAISGASAINTITFISESTDSTKAILRTKAATSDIKYALKFDGASYFHFKKLKFFYGENNQGTLIELTNNASHNAFSNCFFEIGAYGYPNIAIRSNELGVNSNQFFNNHFNSGGTAIWLESNNPSISNYDQKIIGNTFKNQGSSAIKLARQDSVLISDNYILSTGIGKAIEITFCDTSLTITKNTFDCITNIGGEVIYLAICNVPALIANNSIHYESNSTATESGIELYSCEDIKIFFNSVNVTGSNPSASAFTTNNALSDVKNNNFTNANGYAFFVLGDNMPTSDYNNLFTQNDKLGYYKTSFSTILDWQAATLQDNHSVSVNPYYISYTDLHTNCIDLNGIAQPIVEVDSDMDDNPRDPSNPDIGAYEFNPLNDDAGLVSVSPNAISLAGSHPIYVDFRNFGISSLTSATIGWTMDGITQTPFAWNGTLASKDTLKSIEIGNYNFTSGSHQLKVWISEPNGAQDLNPVNDTLIYTIKVRLHGTFTIGQGGDFATINEAVALLVSGGVDGAVTLNILDGEYNERIEIPAIEGTSDINTIELKSQSNNKDNVRIYADNSNYNKRYVFHLNGCSHIILNHLTIHNVLDKYETGNPVSIYEGSSYINIKNSHIIGLNSNVASIMINSQAIRIWGETSDQLAIHIVIENNTIENGDRGLYAYKATNLEVRNNTFTNFKYQAIQMYIAQDVVIDHNQVSGSGNGGVDIEVVKKFSITGNKINLPSTLGGFGIRIYDCTNELSQLSEVSNNFIRINSHASNYENENYGLYAINVAYINLYHNTVLVTGNNTTSIATSYRCDTTVKVQNNQFVNKAGGYAFYLEKPSLCPIDSCKNDYNNYFTTGSVFGLFPSWKVGESTIVLTNLAEWQTLSNIEDHSQSIDPEFISDDDLHTYSVPLNNKGLLISGVVTDIDGDTRTADNTDIGADNYDAIATDLGVVSITRPAEHICAGADSVFVTIKNYGLQNVSSVLISWKLDNELQNPVEYNNLISSTQVTAPIFIGQPDFTSGIHTLKVWTSHNSDITAHNDTALYTVHAHHYSGIYTVAGTDPDFISLTTAIDSLMKHGICGTVVLNIRPGTYTEKITIGNISGISEENELIIQSETLDNTEVVLQSNGDSQSNYVIKLSSCSYVTLQYLTFKALNTSYGGLVSIEKASQFNKFRYNVFEGISTTLVGTLNTLVRSSAWDNDFYTFNIGNSFTNNIFRNGIKAFYVSGSNEDFTCWDYYLEIADNEFVNQYRGGIDIYDNTSPRVERNTFTSTTTGNYDAINLFDCVNNLRVSNNIINLPNSLAGTGISITNFATAYEYGQVHNNVVAMQINGSTTYKDGIAIYGSNELSIAHNSVNLFGTNPNANALALYNSTGYACDDLDFYNNIFSNTGSGRALYDYANGTFRMDNNCYYAPTGTLFTTKDPTFSTVTNYTTLTAWINQFHLDSNSVNTNPQFITNTNLHTISSDLNNTGKALAYSILDMDGVLHSATQPDIGADEFDVADKYLYTSESSIAFTVAASSSKSFGLYSNTDWTISSDQSWITVDVSSGSNNSTINLTTEQNLTINPRNATITISGTGVSTRTITVTQVAGAAFLDVSVSTLSISYLDNSTATFDISSNIDWTASSSQSWLTVNDGSRTGNQTVGLTAVANPAAVTRTAAVTISGSGVSSKTVTVTQQAAPTYTISATANPISSGSINGTGNYIHGQSASLTATPNIGYTFTNWTENDDTVSTDATYTFTATCTRLLVANFTLKSYTITASADPIGSGTITGIGTYSHGDAVSLNANPATGYSFTSWTENGDQVSNEANYTFTATGNRTLVANFSLNSYTISASVYPANSGNVEGVGSYNHGDEVSITATPNTGYSFTNWTEDGIPVSSDANYTFTATANRTLVANFTLNTYTISATVYPENSGTVDGINSYNHGENVTLAANPNPGYTFTNWTENGNIVSYDATYTFTATSNRVLVATFTLNTYTIAATASPENSGFVEGTGTYNHGYEVTLIATPETGYSFLNWTENGEQVSVNPSYTFTAEMNRTLVANFTLKSYTIAALVSPVNSGNVEGVGNYNYGDLVTLTATPANGYTFINWTENSNVISTDASYEFNVTRNVELVANFNLKTYSVATSVSPVSSGTVSGDGNYTHGATVTLTATPNTGYNFISWTENNGIVSTDATYIFIASGDRAVVANFALDSYSIATSVNPANSGTVEGTGTFNHGDAVTLTAIPSAGYTFINWTENGSEVSTEVTYTFTATDNRTLVANFSLNLYTIAVSINPVNSGTVTGADSYSHGEEVLLTATPNTGYTFINWTENGSEVSTESNYLFTATGNRNLAANFSLNTYTISAMVSPVNSGTIEGTGTFNHGDMVTLTATPASGYNFVNWTENGSEVSSIATYTFTASNNRNLVANFTEATTVQYTLTISITGNGTVNINGNPYTQPITVDEGTIINLSAYAEQGWQFEGWTGDLTSANIDESIVLSGNKSITATFTQIPTYTLTLNVSPENSGTVTGEGSYEEGTVVSVSANPANEYRFVNWKNGENIVSTTTLFNYTMPAANATLTAYFERIIYNVSFHVTSGENVLPNASVVINSVALTTNSDGNASIALPNGDYPYSVSATGYLEVTGNVSVNSSDISVDVNLTLTGIDEKAIADFSVYPNPFTDKVTIASKNRTKGSYIITSIVGSNLKTGLINNEITVLDLSELRSGIYILQVNNQGVLHTIRIVKE